MAFNLKTPLKPQGDQPKAIEKLVMGVPARSGAAWRYRVWENLHYSTSDPENPAPINNPRPQ